MKNRKTEYLSRKEAAEALRLTLSKLDTRIARGEIPCVRSGNRVLIPGEAVLSRLHGGGADA